MTSLETIATLPTWFTLAQFADSAGMNRQKARGVLGKLRADGLIERRITNPTETANLWKHEYIITAKGRERTK